MMMTTSLSSPLVTDRLGSSASTFLSLTRALRAPPTPDGREMEAFMAAITEEAEEDLASMSPRDRADRGETGDSRGKTGGKGAAGDKTLRSPTLWMRTDKEDRAETSESLLVS